MGLFLLTHTGLHAHKTHTITQTYKHMYKLIKHQIENAHMHSYVDVLTHTDARVRWDVGQQQQNKLGPFTTGRLSQLSLG